MTAPLNGLRVGVTANRARGESLADTLRKAGATVSWGPTVDVVATPTARVRAETAAVLRAEPTWVAVTTVDGVRAWVDAAGPVRAGLVGLLASGRVAARGAGVAQAVTEVGGRVGPVAASGRGGELARLVTRETGPGGTVAVQVDGGGSPAVVDHLLATGVEVVTVRPQRWAPPADLGPASELVGQLTAGDLDLITFTSPADVDGLLEVAADKGRAREVAATLGATVAVAAVGPVTAEALEARGIRVAVCPSQPTVHALASAVAVWRAVPVEGASLALDPVSRSACRGKERVALSNLEFALLASLSRRVGRTCPTAVLLQEVWGDGDRRRLEVLVSRLRSRLAPLGLEITAVPKRGYRLEGA